MGTFQSHGIYCSLGFHVYTLLFVKSRSQLSWFYLNLFKMAIITLLLVLTRTVRLSVRAHSSCVALVFPWLWFYMRFTWQFSLYYCCVQVVPDRINQCLWITAAQHLRCWSAAQLVYLELFTGAIPCSCFINAFQKPSLNADPWLTPCHCSDIGLGLEWWWVIPHMWRGLWCACHWEGGNMLSGPKPNFHWKIEEAKTCPGQGAALFFLSRLLITSSF